MTEAQASMTRNRPTRQLGNMRRAICNKEPQPWLDNDAYLSHTASAGSRGRCIEIIGCEFLVSQSRDAMLSVS